MCVCMRCIRASPGHLVFVVRSNHNLGDVPAPSHNIGRDCRSSRCHSTAGRCFFPFLKAAPNNSSREVNAFDEVVAHKNRRRTYAWRHRIIGSKSNSARPNSMCFQLSYLWFKSRGSCGTKVQVDKLFFDKIPETTGS